MKTKTLLPSMKALASRYAQALAMGHVQAADALQRTFERQFPRFELHVDSKTFLQDSLSGESGDSPGSDKPKNNEWEGKKFEESAHPRGQPENAGQFGPGGGGGKKPDQKKKVAKPSAQAQTAAAKHTGKEQKKTTEKPAGSVSERLHKAVQDTKQKISGKLSEVKEQVQKAVEKHGLKEKASALLNKVTASVEAKADAVASYLGYSESKNPEKTLAAAKTAIAKQKEAKGKEAPKPQKNKPLVAAFEKTIDAQKNLSEGHKAAYKAAVSRVIGAMPESAAKLMADGVKKVSWHPDTKSLTNSWSKATGKSLEVLKGGTVNGYYDHKEGKATLDGVTRKTNAPGMGGDTKNIHGTYAHELTHGIDKGNRFSKQKDWQEAFKTEIAGKVRLSKYAQTSPSEGFAEFGRALYGSDVSHDKLKKQFPKCWDYFSKNGLI